VLQHVWKVADLVELEVYLSVFSCGGSHKTGIEFLNRAMTTTLLCAGLACIIAAVVGGRLKAYGIEVPVLQSVPRQVILGVFGMILVIISFFLYLHDGEGHPDVAPQTNPGENATKTKPPKPHPENRKPDTYITVASQPVKIGDFSFIMKDCLRFDAQGELRRITEKEVRCEGTIENQRDTKLQMTFTNGRVIDDLGNEYSLSTYAYLLGAPGQLFFGSANIAQELIPNLPVKFGFVMVGMKRDATAASFILDFTTSGNPPSKQVVFKEIPIREE